MTTSYFAPSIYTNMGGTAWANPSYAYDGSLATSTTNGQKASNTVQIAQFSGFPSVTLTGLTLDIAYTLSAHSGLQAGTDIACYAELDYSLDNGINWTYLDQALSDDGITYTVGPGANYASFNLDSYAWHVDLSGLVVRVSIYSMAKPTGIGNSAGSVGGTIYDIRANASYLSGTAPTISYQGSPFSYSSGAVVNITPTTTGSPTSYFITPPLSGVYGLTFDTTTGVISGTATTHALTSYSITATNGGGTSAPTNISITVNAASGTAPTISYSGSPYLFAPGQSVYFSPATLTGSPAPTISVSPSLSGLGLMVNSFNGIISGTAVAGPIASYTVLAQNGTSPDGQAIISIGVGQAPAGLSYTPQVSTIYKGTAITPMSPTVSYSPTNYTVTPALPAGLTLSSTTGVISGTPTTNTAAAYYSIQASNAWGATGCSINITVVTAPVTVSYPSAAYAWPLNVAITSQTPTLTGIHNALTHTNKTWIISPSLPAGLAFSTLGVISGTPTAASSGSYVVDYYDDIDGASCTISIVTGASGGGSKKVLRLRT